MKARTSAVWVQPTLGPTQCLCVCVWGGGVGAETANSTGERDEGSQGMELSTSNVRPLLRTAWPSSRWAAHSLICTPRLGCGSLKHLRSYRVNVECVSAGVRDGQGSRYRETGWSTSLWPPCLRPAPGGTQTGSPSLPGDGDPAMLQGPGPVSITSSSVCG